MAYLRWWLRGDETTAGSSARYQRSKEAARRRIRPRRGDGTLRNVGVDGAQDGVAGVGHQPEALFHETCALAYDPQDVVPVVSVERMQPGLIERDIVPVKDAEPGELRRMRHRIDGEVRRDRHVEERCADASERVAEPIALDRRWRRGRVQLDRGGVRRGNAVIDPVGERAERGVRDERERVVVRNDDAGNALRGTVDE